MPRPTPSPLIAACLERPSLLPDRIQKVTEQDEEEVLTVEPVGPFESHVRCAPHWGDHRFTFAEIGRCLGVTESAVSHQWQRGKDAQKVAGRPAVLTGAIHDWIERRV
jgi:hypothetical protein